MNTKRILCLLLSAVTMLCFSGKATAAETDCDVAYCFSGEDFSTSSDPLTGICITALPDENTGTVMLGHRVVQKGDILTAQQVTQMTFVPLRTETDAAAMVGYLPIYENRVEPATTMTISIRGKEDKAPVAQDLAMETYKNLPNQGKLKVTDPEGQPMTYSLIKKPKRGSVTINADGTFVYTPKKNKVGPDSFTYTATDPAGKVSREATVSIQILKPTTKKQYTDTVGMDCRFEAEWLRNTGLFEGESINGQSCFQPEKTVSRGQFLALLVKALDIPTKNAEYTDLQETAPQWLRPYLAAALRSGLISGLPKESMEMDAPITGAEAAVMLQNAMDLSADPEALEQVSAMDEAVPTWAAASLAAMSYNGICLSANEVLTREDMAHILYQADYLALTAPGMMVIRKQG